MRIASSRVVAIGFSTSTCSPAAAESRVIGACRACGTVITTASRPPASIIARWSVKTRVPASAASFSAASARTSHTAATFTWPDVWRAAATWNSAMVPAPMTPRRRPDVVVTISFLERMGNFSP